MGWVFRRTLMFFNRVYLVVKEWPCEEAHQTRSVLAVASRGQFAAAVHIHGWFVGPLSGRVGQLVCLWTSWDSSCYDQLKGMMDCSSSWKQPWQTWVIVMCFPFCLSLFINCTWQVSLTLLTFSNIHIVTLAFGLWSLCAVVRGLVTLNPNL